MEREGDNGIGKKGEETRPTKKEGREKNKKKR